MRGKKTTNKIIDLLLTIVVIALSVSLVTLDVKAYDVNSKYVANDENPTVVLSESQKNKIKEDKTDNNAEKSDETLTDDSEKQDETDTNNDAVSTQNDNSNDNITVDSSNTNTNAASQAAVTTDNDQDDSVQAVSGVTKVGRVYIKGNISVDRATYLNNACNYIPGPVLNAFDQLGFKIEIGNYNQSWAGLFNSQTGYIYIENNTSMDYVYVLSHEMGHFLDLLKNLSSETGEFRNVYNAERLKLSPKYMGNYNYYTTSPTEYYAECFSQYVIENPKLANSNPKTYSYLQSDLNTISQSQINYIGEALKLARR